MGFCFIDSVVVAAKYALAEHKAQKVKEVAILDWDIHDGNGTSEGTIQDDNIFRIDIHRFNPKEGFYPLSFAMNH
jgi:acetoin utilization deacetylase AcuC-like enzyme